MATTYELIMSGTCSGTSSTLNSIPTTYTDLVLVINYSFGGSYGGYNNALQVNGGNATHSTTVVGGNGSTASSSYQASNTEWLMSFPIGSPTTQASGIVVAHFNNYANTNIYKPVLIRHNVPLSSAPGLQQGIGLYHSTTAINSITIKGNSGSTLAEGTMYLYGIKAA
jgi:hypothetical protein